MSYLTAEDTVKRLLRDYLTNRHVQEMDTFFQHGSVTTLQHCLNVAVLSYFLCSKLHLKVCVSSLLTGAILHDFYLYDWHDGRFREEGIHGFSHPKVALQNARHYFNLTEKEQNIIASHMFPLTIREIPKSREAVVVCIADKLCAIREYLRVKK